MMSHKTKQIIITIASLAVLVALAIILFGGINKEDSFGITKKEKQEAIEFLTRGQVERAPITDEEKQEAIEFLTRGQVERAPITDEEKQEALDFLQSGQ
jgi:hypothetical protein